MASSGDRSLHSHHVHVSFLLEINNLVVISAIINLVVIRGLGPVVIPRVVDWPGSCLPHSHLIMILNWWLWRFWLSNPVEDLIVISRVISSLWPWVGPVSIWLQFFSVNSLNSLLDESMFFMMMLMMSSIDTNCQEGRKS